MKKTKKIVPLMFTKAVDVGNSLIRTFANSLILLCLVSIAAYSQSPGELYKNASQLYKSNQFEPAAGDYEKILAQGYKNHEVYYNLGNCYYKMNNIGKSILNYERALKLSPDDEDVQNNLKMANLRTSDKIQPVPQMAIITNWNHFVSSNSSKGWGIYSIISVWLALIVFAVYLFTGVGKIFRNTGFFILFISLCFLSLAFMQNDKEQNSNAAILMVTNSFVKSAPDANGNDLFMIHEGIKLQVLDHIGEWNKIRLADGKVGWLEKSNFEKI